VNVRLGDNADHYYVLSRFLLSKMLTITKTEFNAAMWIRFELILIYRERVVPVASMLTPNQFEAELLT
ncbi:hypothetical protein HN51_012449, partial [Arachis hypogaea]